MTNPRLILICCEGKSEEAYFNALISVKRINSTVVAPAESFGGSQHMQLIDISVDERTKMCEKYEFNTDEVEVWAVFDKDSWRQSFTVLEKYARQKGVMLAYSNPQFETYLVQHLEQSAYGGSGGDLDAYLSSLLVARGYDEYEKGNLDWLIDMIDIKPKIIETAIANADIRSRRTQSPFLTVQNLTRRLLEFELR